MSVNELQTLPDSIMVKLKSGRVASLGTLRMEHRARLSRFSRAASLGQAFAARLAAQPASAAQLSLPSNSARPTPLPSTEDRNVRTGANRVPVGIGGTLGVASDRTLVPFAYPATAPKPKDYADFCKAANASVCIYLPANSTFSPVPGTPESDPFLTGPIVMDEDPLIFDAGVCMYSGGFYVDRQCTFFYIFDNLINFKPTGPVTTKVACDLPAKYLFDPKGAVEASYPYTRSTFVTGGTEVRCAVQVWIGK